MSISVSSDTREVEAQEGYPSLERLVAQRIAAIDGPVFTTDVENLYDVFLSGLPAERRQHYNCHACRNFVNRFGGLVRISESGEAGSIFWLGDMPEFFQASSGLLWKAIRKSRISGVFLSSLKTFGTPVTKEWTHLHGVNPHIFAHPLKSDAQAMAEKKEEYAMLRRSLAEFPNPLVAEAVRVLQADALDRSEKTLGVAKWLLRLHESMDGAKGHCRDNLAWLAVASAPLGFCHVRSSMIGSLLEDLQAGMTYQAVAARWAQEMHPLQYQRPTTLHEGTIKQAEEAVAKMGAAGSLKRRFARLSDVVAIWRPKESPAEPQGGSVFGHLRAGRKAEPSKLVLPAKTLTWEKFARDVLPSVLKMEFAVPSHGPFFGLVTAADMDAPPILQWDGEPRNPVSWYFYVNGSSCRDWNLSPQFTAVNAVCLKPPHWHDAMKFAHQGDAAFFILEGCRDTSENQGCGLFPECLRSEYHGIRSAIEAYSRTAKLEDRDEADANGYALQKGGTWNARVRVMTGAGPAEYVIDRWD